MSPLRLPFAVGLTALLALAFVSPARAVTATGRLQIIQLDVGQGDGALIISPLGQTVLIDEGPSGATTAMGVSVLNQLIALGVTRIDHHFASHYHADHIGNFLNLVNGGIPIDLGWDRAGSYSSTAAYTNYVSTLGSRRRTLVKNQVITLDSLSAHPVRIKCVDLAGAGIVPTPTDENSLSLVLKVTYGEYDEVFGGDLTGGAEGSSSPDIESRVGAAVGPVEVYKVHHHGSRFSSNAAFLAAIAPKIGVIGCGNGNSYGHPTSGALGRLHTQGVKTYWTETGAGVAPLAGWDKVANGQVIISATWEPAGVDTIRGNGFADTFTNSGTPVGDVTPPVANLVSPNGGETWKVGSSQAITWSATDAVGVTSVDLAWSTTGVAPWTAIASAIANSGTYAWTIPAAPTASARVRVLARDAAGNLGADSSSATFTVNYWTIAASAATGGSITPSGVTNVAQGASSSFTISAGAGWQIAGVLVDGGSVGAPVSYQFNGVAANHTIAASYIDVAPPQVAVTSPVGGENWLSGSLHNVTWNATDNQVVDSVSVQYSPTGLAGPWLAVVNGIANSGTYAWTVPATSCDSARVRIVAYDPALNSGAAFSPDPFRIGSGSVAVGEPGAASLDLALPFPNPSRGNTWMRFSLPREGHAMLEILDLAGRRVWLAESVVPAGPHTWAWDGRDLDGGRAGSGLYFVRLTTPWGTRGERLTRLR